MAIKRATYENALPEVAWVQDKLGRFGFNIAHSGMMDTLTRDVIATFQMKYAPSNYGGELDAETRGADRRRPPAKGGMLLARPPAP